MIDLFSNNSSREPIDIQEKFNKWSVLNDTIMGGSSQSSCSSTSKGLNFHGTLIEREGGFVSCRSSVFLPPINLSEFRGFLLEIEGEGRVLKFGVACENSFLGISNFFSRGLKWVAQFPTENSGLTVIKIPFLSLEPSIRAKPVKLPVKFNSSSITQFQLLHSKFGKPGELNPCFTPGPFQIFLRSINVYN